VLVSDQSEGQSARSRVEDHLPSNDSHFLSSLDIERDSLEDSWKTWPVGKNQVFDLNGSLSRPQACWQSDVLSNLGFLLFQLLAVVNDSLGGVHVVLSLCNLAS